MHKLLSLLLILPALGGCAEFLYDIGQDSAMRRCESLASATERADCRRRSSQPYDQYQKDREKLKIPQ